MRDLIEAAVVNSDNDSFIALRAAFDRVGYEDWIVGLGVDYDTALDPMSDFPPIARALLLGYGVR